MKLIREPHPRLIDEHSRAIRRARRLMSDAYTPGPERIQMTDPDWYQNHSKVIADIRRRDARRDKYAYAKVAESVGVNKNLVELIAEELKHRGWLPPA
jgi:hypothetical protein